jgi:hypothetical protein
MTCPEYARLRQLYEAALRHWGNAMWSSRGDVPGVPERLALEIKQRAFIERNDAHERLLAHKRSCKVCQSMVPADL